MLFDASEYTPNVLGKLFIPPTRSVAPDASVKLDDPVVENVDKSKMPPLIVTFVDGLMFAPSIRLAEPVELIVRLVIAVGTLLNVKSTDCEEDS